VRPAGAGAILFGHESSFALTNNIVANNRASVQGGGIVFEAAGLEPLVGVSNHNTFANNTDGGGKGQTAIHLNEPGVSLVLNNNLLSGHSYGVFVVAGSSAELHSTLFYANSVADTGGDGTISSSGAISGIDPRLNAIYHLRANSPAVDAGLLLASVTEDYDGDSRPLAGGYDIGADEYTPPKVYLPVLRTRSG